MVDLIVCEQLFHDQELCASLVRRLRSEHVRYRVASQPSQGVAGILVTDKDSRECKHLSAANIICHIDFILLYLNTYVGSNAQSLFKFPEENGYYRSLALDGVAVYLTGFNHDEAQKQLYMRMVAEMGGTLLVSRLPGHMETEGGRVVSRAQHPEGGPLAGLSGSAGLTHRPQEALASALEDHEFFQMLENLWKGDADLRRVTSVASVGLAGRPPDPRAKRLLVVVGCSQSLSGLLKREWPEDRRELLSFFLSKVVGAPLIDYLYNQAISTGLDLTEESRGATAVSYSDARRGPSILGLELSPNRLAEYRLKPFLKMKLCVTGENLFGAPGPGLAAETLNAISENWAQCLRICKDLGADLSPAQPTVLSRLLLPHEQDSESFYAMRPGRTDPFRGYHFLVPRKAFVLSTPPERRSSSSSTSSGERDRYRLSICPETVETTAMTAWQAKPSARYTRRLGIHTHSQETVSWLAQLHESRALTVHRRPKDRGPAQDTPKATLKASLAELTGNYRLMLQVLYCKPFYICLYGLDDLLSSRTLLRQFLEEKLLFGTVVETSAQNGVLAEASTLRVAETAQAAQAASFAGEQFEPQTKRTGELTGQPSVSSVRETTTDEAEGLDYLLGCCEILPTSALGVLGPAFKSRLFIVADTSLYFNRALTALQEKAPTSRGLFRSPSLLAASVAEAVLPSDLFRTGHQANQGEHQGVHQGVHQSEPQGEPRGDQGNKAPQTTQTAQTAQAGARSGLYKRLLERERQVFGELRDLELQGYNIRTTLWLQLLFEVSVRCHTGFWGGTVTDRSGPAAATPTQHLTASQPQILPTVFPATECASATLALVALDGWKVLKMNQQTHESMQDNAGRYVVCSPDEFIQTVTDGMVGGGMAGEGMASEATGAIIDSAGMYADSAGILGLLLDSERAVDRLKYAYLASLDLIPCDKGVERVLEVSPLTAHGRPEAADPGQSLYLPEFARKMISCCGDFRQSLATSNMVQLDRRLRNEQPGQVQMDFTNPTDLDRLGSYVESRSAAQKSSAMSVFDFGMENYASDGLSAGDARFSRKGG